MTDNQLSEPSVLLISNLFATDRAYGGVCKELAEKLASSGWQVTTTSGTQNRYLRPVDMLRTIWNQRQAYGVAHIDVFSGAAFQWAEVSAWALSRLRKPFALTLHGGNLPAFAQRYPARIRRLLDSACCVTTPSNYLLQALSDYHPAIELIPNPIDLSSYTCRLRSNVQPRLLFLRAIHHTYNPSLTVFALKELGNTFPDATLTIAGPDKRDGTLQALEQTILKTGTQDKVRIIGPVPKADVPRIMNDADIFLNPTNVDNTPVSVIEAMACGLCIVSTNVGGIPYLLTHNHDALLVPPNDPQAMADAVRRILTEPGLAERLSRNARHSAEQFDWSVILPQWEKLLMEAIEKGANGRTG